MTRNESRAFGQPSLEELTLRFLAHRSDALWAVGPDESEVEPHEVASGFRVDPRQAWADALVGVPGLTDAAGSPLIAPPPQWNVLVHQLPSHPAVPWAVGNYPQRVRNLEPLLTRFDPADLRPTGGLPDFVELRSWVLRHAASWPVLAGGLARLLGDFDLAATLLPAGADNERAALLWQSGRHDEALARWQTAAETPAVTFNRGMALLFHGRFAEARDVLGRLADHLPETHGWAALCALYRAVATIHA